MSHCQPQPAPSLSSITPNTGPVGSILQATVIGANFGATGTTVTVGQADIRASGVQVLGPTKMIAQLEILAAATPGQKVIAVTTKGGTSNALGFTVVKAQPADGLMITSQRNPQLAINAWNGARHGGDLRLHQGCRPDNPDCTWTYRKSVQLTYKVPSH